MSEVRAWRLTWPAVRMGRCPLHRQQLSLPPGPTLAPPPRPAPPRPAPPHPVPFHPPAHRGHAVPGHLAVLQHLLRRCQQRLLHPLLAPLHRVAWQRARHARQLQAHPQKGQRRRGRRRHCRDVSASGGGAGRELACRECSGGWGRCLGAGHTEQDAQPLPQHPADPPIHPAPTPSPQVHAAPPQGAYRAEGPQGLCPHRGGGGPRRWHSARLPLWQHQGV
jgi:hypothetical protein